MMEQKMQELCKLYGIEINDVEEGQGGLFFADAAGNKMILDDIFDSVDYATPKHEKLTLPMCDLYSTYSEIASLMANAA